MSEPDVEVFYSADLTIGDWSARHAAGEVPDRWPYGLDQLPGSPISRTRGAWTLRDRMLRRVDNHVDWTARAPRDRPALCWDERTGVPVALTRRSAPVATGAIWLTDRTPTARDALTRRALRRCTAVWALSAAQLEPLHREWGVPADRLRHVLFGVDHHFWSPTSVPPEPDTVLVVGNDVDRDHHLAIAAAQRAQRHRGGLRLTLVTAQHVPVPAAVGERIAAVPHAVLVGRYRSAAVVALATRPNLHASGVTALLEAMACGRPVVASATPGMADYVTDGVTGLLVAPGDEQAMADAIVSLLADPVAAEAMGRAGRTAVEQNFTSAAMASRLAALVTT